MPDAILWENTAQRERNGGNLVTYCNIILWRRAIGIQAPIETSDTGNFHMQLEE